MCDQSQTHQDISELSDACPRGSIIGIKGFPGRTETGEFSVVAQDISLLASCDKNLPMMNWNHKKTLKDSEKRFKHRYLDLIVNHELKAFFFTRMKIIKFFRKYLDDMGFLEVETPILNG